MSDFTDEDYPYREILYLKRPESGRHPKMSLEERAAQFSPFAALTGFGACVERTAEKQEEVSDRKYEDTDSDWGC